MMSVIRRYMRWSISRVIISFFCFFWYSFAQVCSVALESHDDFEPSEVWVWFHDVNNDGVYNPADGDAEVVTIDGRETTLVGDIDGDGMPEVIVDDYKNPWKIWVFDGQSGAVEHEINTNTNLAQNNSSNAIADTDGNGFGEVYLVDRNRKLYRYDFDGSTFNQTWISPDLVSNYFYVPHIADFDGDGVPEIHMGTQIFRVSDGKKIIDGGFNPWDLWWSVAADILPSSACTHCAWLELVMGSKVFALDIVWWVMTQERFDGLPWRTSSRYPTSIADMDNDGDLDIVYSAVSIDNDPWIVVWDGQTDTVMMTYEIHDANPGIWRINIADFDGDGYNEMWVVSYARYTAVDDIFNSPWWAELWRISNQDFSAVTSSSVFDFDYDGIYEVVYRDQFNLFILDGPTWATKFITPCRSGTRRENPVIADVNNDGQTEIIVICTDPVLTPTWTKWRVKTFASASAPWAPSRPVWNQHGYNITNVNDDLTIPTIPKDNATRESWVHNTFLTQSLPIDSDFVLLNNFLPPGNVFAADAQLTITDYFTWNCSQWMDIELLIENIWDASIPASTPIQIYDSDPTIFSSNLIWMGTVWTVLWTWTNTTILLPVSTCVSPLFAVVNDGTTSAPYTLTWSTDFPNTSTAECVYSNNIDSQSFRYCGDGILDTWEECDDPKICNDWSVCAQDIECDQDITSGLIMHHQFQWWSLVDATGNWNDGILMWDAQIFDWITDESVSFDGYDDWMRVPHSSSLDLTTDITLWARVYPRQFWHGQWAWDFSAIITKWAAYYLNINASWRPQFYWYGLSSPGYHTSPNILPLNTRSHVMATYDGAAWVVNLYVNGVLEKTSVSTGNGTQNTQDVGIGRYPWSDVRELDGVIDDARIYDRPLSVVEINQLYTNWLDTCEWNSLSWDGCSDLCEIEYCRDDAPLHDTSKNLLVTNLDATSIAGTSSQANSKIAICMEDTTGTRDIFYTTTDASWAFTYTPNLAPYTAPWINIGVMLHDENDLDIDHHALTLPK